MREFDGYESNDDITTALEGERRRIAGLIQAHLIESVNTLLAQANAYEQMFHANQQAHLTASALAGQARQLLQQALNLQANLHPTVLDSLGLEAALELLVSQESRAHGISITLHLAHLRERLPGQIELALFRVAQDALYRAMHSRRANRVTLRLFTDTDSLTMTCADNGTAADDDLLRTSIHQFQGLGGSIHITENPSEVRVIFPIVPRIDLTERESDVLQALVDGQGNKQIAARLGISPRTVKFHLDNIYLKLHVSTRTEAVVFALRHGLARHPR